MGQIVRTGKQIRLSMRSFFFSCTYSPFPSSWLFLQFQNGIMSPSTPAGGFSSPITDEVIPEETPTDVIGFPSRYGDLSVRWPMVPSGSGFWMMWYSQRALPFVLAFFCNLNLRFVVSFPAIILRQAFPTRSFLPMKTLPTRTES